jgi:hypothetical protein
MASLGISAIPATLVFSAVWVKQEGAQCDFEEKRDGVATGDLVPEADVCELGQNPESQSERREGRHQSEPPSETAIVRHEKSGEHVRGDDRQTDEQSERTFGDACVTDPIRAIKQADESEEPVEIEEPGGYLESLGLHAVEPSTGIEAGT